MAENEQALTPRTGMKALSLELSSDRIKKKFEDMLGKKAPGFLASISSVVANNTLLQKADVGSITLAAAQAAALDLPINPNIGYAAIVPYKGAATLQIMRNGYVELALRSGQVAAIENELVYEGELVSSDRFKGEYVFDESKRISNKVIGAMAYVRLINGFEKTVYWTREKCMEHGKKYSKTFGKDSSLWTTNPEAMILKTVLKNLIVKFIPKSIEMITAITTDGAHFSGDIDNPHTTFDDAELPDTTYEEVKIDELPDAPAETPQPEAPKAEAKTEAKFVEEDF